MRIRKLHAVSDCLSIYIIFLKYRLTKSNNGVARHTFHSTQLIFFPQYYIIITLRKATDASFRLTPDLANHSMESINSSYTYI